MLLDIFKYYSCCFFFLIYFFSIILCHRLVYHIISYVVKLFNFSIFIIYLFVGLWWSAFIRFLPHKFRPKPCAKTGVRTYVSSSVMMNKIIKKSFSSATIVEKKEKLRNEIKKRNGLLNKNYLWKKKLMNLMTKLINKMMIIANFITGKKNWKKSDGNVNYIDLRSKDNKIENKNESENKNENKNENKKKNENENDNENNKIVDKNKPLNKIEISFENDKNVQILNPIYTGTAKSKWIAKNSKNDVEENEKLSLVGLFVYAWIKPFLRRRFFGNVLLACGEEMCRELGADYMILVHDDNGSGRLISYYEKKGFIPIFDMIEKGMIGII